MTFAHPARILAHASVILGAMAATGLSLLATWAGGSGAVPAARAGQASAADMAAMKAEYKRPAAAHPGNGPLVELGRALFWDPRVSASGTTACVNCHFPHLGWSSTEPRSRNDSGRLTGRRSQPLLGLRHAKDAPAGWDGRAPTLEAQVKLAVATGAMSMRETSTPVRVELIEARIQAIPEYASAFASALPEAAVNMDSIATAIAAYERTIEPGIAAFDRWIAGDESAISESAKRGFVLFNTKGNCFACHKGWRFTDDKFHDIGIATADLGRGRAINDVSMNYAFKTPTLRSVALRPPYFHDGSAANLYEIVKVYEKGGIDRPTRSPLMLPLRLNEQERLDLVAFMQTLTGVPEGEPAPMLPGSK